MMGFTFVFIILLLSIIGPGIRPDSSANANQQFLSLARLKPLSSVMFIQVKSNFRSDGSLFDLVPFETYEIQQKRLKVNVYSSRGIEEVHYYSFIDLFYPVNEETIQEYALNEDSEFHFTDLNGDLQVENGSDIESRVQALVTSKVFILGTDHFGRDLLSRLMAGSSVSLLVGLLSTLIALIIGFLIGSLAGYFSGIWEGFLGTLINIFWSIPAVMLVVAFVMVLGDGIIPLAMGIGMILWVEMAQVIKAEVYQLRNKDFILASRLKGLSNSRILFTHILPNVSGTMLVLSISVFAEAILLEAGLSFMGIGIQPPRPSWGNMIREAYGYAIMEGAFLALVPRIAIVLLVMSFMAISRGIKAAISHV